MNAILNRIFGINYRTSVLGIGVIVAAVGRLAVAYKSKDFTSMATDAELVMGTAASLLAGWGLFIAKDGTVTGAGSQAVAVASSGLVTNIDGKAVGTQVDKPVESTDAPAK